MKARLLATIAILLCSSGVSAAPQEPSRPLAPRDDCAALPGFASFDARLKAAVAQKDSNALLTVTSDDVLLDFGGGAGKDDWRQRLEEGEYNSWADLAATIALGCDGEAAEPGSDSEASAAYPWFWSNNQGELDPYAAHLVTGNQVLVRAEPSPTGRILGSVSWNWVEANYEAPVNGYSKVTTLDGTSGYMAVRYLRSLVDYRLLVEKRDGKWQITAFIAGD